MKARVIQILIAPWHLDYLTCELRVSVEVGGKQYEDRQPLQSSDFEFEAVFEQGMKQATATIQRIITADTEPNMQRGPVQRGVKP